MVMTRTDLSRHIIDEAAMAELYLSDGAHFTAAQRLERLAATVRAWAVGVDDTCAGAGFPSVRPAADAAPIISTRHPATTIGE